VAHSDTLSQVIQQCRSELGLTQTPLGEQIGVLQVEGARLEADRIDLPRRERTEQIAAALNVPIGKLLAHPNWTVAEASSPPALEMAPERRGDEMLGRDDVLSVPRFRIEHHHVALTPGILGFADEEPDARRALDDLRRRLMARGTKGRLVLIDQLKEPECILGTYKVDNRVLSQPTGVP
jgi:transcriptional regulator with XRE-family HTH domain